MYGLVNRAIEQMICAHHGEAMWERVRVRAGVEEDVFLSHESYPDELTYRLVGAASELLGLSADAILEAFGEHWVLKTGREGYGDLMLAQGDTLPEFLENLPSFHTRVAMMFPDLKPPRFAVSDRAEGSLHLHYRTGREGLTAFVVGLLRGLGVMFGVSVRVRLIESKSTGGDHDVFLVEW